MEDYIRGIVCGYLTVQRGVKGDAKRDRMFLVLSDSRIDYYVTDPRPEFEQKIANAYMFTPATRLHYYIELNARAPPHSFSLTTDKATGVYIADTDADAKMWYRHLHERLDALATMVKGTLLLCKEISVHEQFKRMLLRTKYKWKQRYIELGRSSLRFCKESEKKTRMMKQFVLTAQSFVSEDEGVEFLKQHRILVSYATAIQPDAKMLAQFKRERQQNQGSQNNCEPTAPRRAISTAYPFVVATGQAHLFLAAPSEHVRSDWVTAIRMRIISLKYRHNGESKKKEANGDDAYQLRGSMDVQIKPGEPWKKRFVELDQDSRVRIKASERKVGSKFETQLIPTRHVAPTLIKANAFVLRNLGREISLAPGSIKETERWVTMLQRAAKSIRATKVQKLFEDDIRAILAHSVVYTVDVPAGAYAGLAVERFRKRIVVLSHKPPSQDTDAGAKTKKKAKTGIPSIIIPQGSILVSISQFGMAHNSFETIWHHLRHKKGYQHPMALAFRVPCTKHGVLGIKWRSRDAWVLQNCVLEHGKVRIMSLDDNNAKDDGGKSHDVTIVADLPLRHCEVELMSEDNCKNGLKVTLTGGSTTSALATTLFLNVPLDTDACLWLTLLRLESAIAQDDIRYPLSVATLVNSRDGSSQKKATQMNPKPCLQEDQKRCFQKCSVVGVRVEEIEKMAETVDPMLVLQLGNDDFGPAPTATTVTKGDDIHLTMVASTGTMTVSSATERHPLTDADIMAFFHHLDPIGCGKISSVALTQLVTTITRHLVKDNNSSKQPQTKSATNQDKQQQSFESRPGVLSGFYAAVNDLKNLNSNEQREDANMSLSLGEFRTVMQNITDADVLDLVQKLTRHDIQCM
ncbi:hypothetical protein FI667_g12115, partial [Globisporangium splendens]